MHFDGGNRTCEFEISVRRLIGYMRHACIWNNITYCVYQTILWTLIIMEMLVYAEYFDLILSLVDIGIKYSFVNVCHLGIFFPNYDSFAVRNLHYKVWELIFRVTWVYHRTGCRWRWLCVRGRKTSLYWKIITSHTCNFGLHVILSGRLLCYN